jgi:hypothetical protein
MLAVTAGQDHDAEFWNPTGRADVRLPVQQEPAVPYHPDRRRLKLLSERVEALAADQCAGELEERLVDVAAAFPAVHDNGLPGGQAGGAAKQGER